MPTAASPPRFRKKIKKTGHPDAVFACFRRFKRKTSIILISDIMKKYIFFAASLLLLSMASCQKDETDSENGGGITRTEESGAFTDSTSVNLKPISSGFCYSTECGPHELRDTCFLVNNSEAIEPKYFGDQEIPEIDFEKQTLLVGKVWAPCLACMLKEQSVNVTDDFVIVNLVISEPLTGLCALEGIYFWGIYDKLPDEKIVLKKKSVVREDPE